jgi:hypothetical protein
MATLLSLDLSSKTGWSFWNKNSLQEWGRIDVPIEDFNVNKDPNKSPLYPYNLLDSARNIAESVMQLIQQKQPTHVVIENTVKGKNRHTQRFLEWMHMAVCELLRKNNIRFTYMDPSEWRGVLEIRLSKDDKKNNAKVNKAAKLGISKKTAGVKGKVGRKHLSVRFVNETFDLKFKLKDNDMADSICLGYAFLKKDTPHEELVQPS